MIDNDTVDNGQGLPSSLPHSTKGLHTATNGAKLDGCGSIVCSCGLGRYLLPLDDARRFVMQIGGSHGV